MLPGQCETPSRRILLPHIYPKRCQWDPFGPLHFQEKGSAPAIFTQEMSFGAASSRFSSFRSRCTMPLSMHAQLLCYDAHKQTHWRRLQLHIPATFIQAVSELSKAGRSMCPYDGTGVRAQQQDFPLCFPACSLFAQSACRPTSKAAPHKKMQRDKMQRAACAAACPQQVKKHADTAGTPCRAAAARVKKPCPQPQKEHAGAPGVQVLNAAQQLHGAAARVGLVVRPARQHRIQQLAAQQQLRDQVHLRQAACQGS